VGSTIPLWSITLSGTYNLMGKPVNVIRRHDREPPRVKRLEWYPETHEVLVELDRVNSSDPDIALIPDSMCIKVCEDDALPAVFGSKAGPKQPEPVAPEPPEQEAKQMITNSPYYPPPQYNPMPEPQKEPEFPSQAQRTHQEVKAEFVEPKKRKTTKKRKPGRPRKK